MNKQISGEASEISAAIEEIETEINSKTEFKQKVEEIRNILLRAENEAEQNMIDSAFIHKYIDKIYVTPVEDNTVEIAVKIFSGATTEKFLSNMRKRHRPAKNSEITDENEPISDNGRTGHMFKKMIQSYEQSLANGQN